MLHLSMPGMLAAAESLTEHPAAILLGFVFVVLVLGVLALVTSLLGRIFIAHEQKQKAAAAALAAAPPVAPTAETPGHPADDGIEASRITAVIAAAVYATWGSGHRILSVHTRPGASGWAAEGRREIFSSRRVHKGRR